MPSHASRVGRLIGLSWLSAPYRRALSLRGPNSLGAGRADPGGRAPARLGGQQVAVGLVAVGPALELDGRDDRRDALGPHLGGAGGVGDVGDDLQRAPQARGTRAGDRVQAEVEDLLEVAGVERREVQGGQRGLGAAGQRRALAARVVADEGERAAGGGGAGEVRVAQRVHRAVQARVLAVPDAEHAVAVGLRQVVGELRAVDGGRGELLVEAGRELDAVLGGEVAQAHDLLVEAAERRALVAGDERRGVQAGALVGPVLVEQHAHDRLDAREEDRAALEDVLVLERRAGAGQLDGRATGVARRRGAGIRGGAVLRVLPRRGAHRLPFPKSW
jgi:hypothetical protein